MRRIRENPSDPFSICIGTSNSLVQYFKVILLIILIVIVLMPGTSYAFQPILHEKFETIDNKDASTSNEGLKEAVGLAGMSASKKISLGGSVTENPVLQFRVRSPEPHYWRGMVYDRYTRDGFEITETKRTTYYPKMQLPYVSKTKNETSLTQEFTIITPQDAVLFAAYEPSLVEDFKSAIEMDIDQVLYINKGLASNDKYSITSHITEFDPGDLRRSSVDYPSQIRDKYIQLPEIPKRVRDLANEVTASGNNSFDKVNNINSFLKSSGNYHYNLSIKPPPANMDGVDYFLFESKEGYCVYFASAMVVMARSIGIPARFVTGYAVGVWNPIMEAYDVTGSNAHAWVEIYFEGYGWVEFDPTAPKTGKDGGTKKDTELIKTPVIKKLPTITMINSYPEIAYRGNQFKIDGYVSTSDGSGAQNMEVNIFANKSKSTPGFLIAITRTDTKGIFSSNITLPLDFTLDIYNIIARSNENSKYSGSDSDPKIAVKSKTYLTSNLKYEENTLKIDGSLTDDSGKPIPDNSIRIYINDSSKDSIITDKKGKYSIDRNIAPGEYDVKVEFSQTYRYGASSLIQHIDTVKKNIELSLSAKPESLDRNTTLNIVVRIASQDIPVDNAVILIYDQATKIGDYMADEKGTTSIEYTFPKNASPGAHIITSEFNGDATHNKATATANVFVYSNTYITIVSDKQKVDPDGFITFNGTLITDDFSPLGGKRIDIVAGNKNITTVTTNDSGEYSASIGSSDLGTGKFTLQAQFNSDSQLFRSSSSEKIGIEILSGFSWSLLLGGLASVLLIGFVYYKYGFKKSKKIHNQQLAIQQDQPQPAALPDPKTCVIACYNLAKQKLKVAGINKNREQTHWEFFRKVADIRSSISENLKILTQLYEEAYYSKHIIEEKHSTQARSEYKEIRENVEKR